MFLTLQKYLVKSFVKHFFVILFFILCLIFAVEALELFRRIGSGQNVSFIRVLYLSLLKLPQTVNVLLPFIFLFAGMITFSTLTKYKELIVMRAAGMSAFKIIMPVAIASFVLGVIYLLMLNPLFATMSQKYKMKKDALVGQQEEIFDIGGSGIWIRDGGDVDDAYFIRAKSMNKKQKHFSDVTFYRYKKDLYFERIDAKKAILKKGHWAIERPMVAPLDQPPYQLDTLDLPSTIELKNISDYLTEPEMLSFWQLSSYIDQLKSHGFKSDRYELYYHALLSKPLLFLGMLLFSGIFSFQRSRVGQKASMIIGGVVGGLALFFMNNIMLVLGLNQTIPLFVAAWGSTYFVLALSFFILSKIEE